MTNPDNVGGLLPCPFCGGAAERIDFGAGSGDNEGGSCIACTKCQASGPVEFGYKENFVSNWNRRNELCRAAPAGGDAEYSDRIADLIGGSDTPVVCEDGDANCKLWDILANAFGDDDIGNAREWLREEVYEAMQANGVGAQPPKDSAPAGSGEVDLEEFREAVDLLRITSLGGKRDCERYGTFPHDFDRSLEKANRLLALIDARAALLRKLQQGADSNV